MSASASLDVASVDWKQWQPQISANLVFIVHEGKVLLMRKKRGLGAGKVNAPGGKIEPGETAVQAAIRETTEELCVTPISPRQGGELFFQFADGLSIYCVVFSATEFSGEATETDEAVPMWTPLEQIPYEEMWRDDREWLPLLLAGCYFRGYFCFDGDTMLSMKIDVESASS